jgi:transcriptional regulator with XRE-family HTH domain
MELANIRDELRDYLNKGVNLAEIERSTSLNRSWLSKFKRGEIKSPTIDQLVELDNYRQTAGGAA